MAGQERDGPVKGRPAGPTGPVSVPRKPRRRPSADPAKNPLAQGPPAPTRTTRVPRTTYPASSGMGAGTRAASAPYRPPPPPPRSTPHRTDRDAVVWAAKNSPAVAVHLLAPQAKPPTLPSVAPYRRGQGPVPVRVSRPVTYVERGHPSHVLSRGVEHQTVYVPRPKAATRGEQYRWALKSPASVTAAKKLADSMTPAERQQVLRPSPGPEHKHFWQSLWDAYQHQVSAFTGGLSAAGAGRSLSQEELQAALLPKTAVQGTATVAGLAAASLAQRAAAAYQQQVAGYTGGLRAAGTGRPLSRQELQAGLLPETLGVGVYKQGLATVGAAAAFRHPIGALQGIWREGGAMAAGNTQMAGLIAAMSTGQMSTREMKKVVDDLVDATLEDLNRRVGPNTSLRQVYNIGRDEPFMTTLNTLAVVSGSTKLLAFGSELAKGESVGGALARIRAARQAVRVPAEPRRFTISEASYAAQQAHHAEAPGGLTVETHWSENPVTRARQRGYDVVSRKAEHAGLGRVPVVRRITESSRGARKLRAQRHRAARRETARIHTFMRDIEAGTRGDPALETRLALLQQKPKGLTDDEFIQAAAADIRQMLEGREFSAPEQMTPAMRQLINTARSYERRAALARDARRHRAMRNMGAEQTRLAQTLERVQRNRADLHDEYLTIETSGLSVAQKAQARDELGIELEQQDGFAQVLKQELDDLTADQPPVEHPARDQARAVLNGLPWYRRQVADGASKHIADVRKAEARVARANQRVLGADTPFQRGRAERDLTRAEDQLDALHRRGPANAVDDSIAIADTRARVWSRQTGRAPGEWWAGRDLRHVAPDEIPSEVLHQRGRVDGIDDAELSAESRKIFKRWGRSPGAMPPGVKGYKGLAAKGRELARLAVKGEDGKDWYTWSGNRIHDVVGDDWDAAVKISMAIAFLSRTDSVQANVGHALRAFRNYLIDGDVGRAGKYPNVARAELNRIFKTGEWGGYKTNAFFRNILEEVDKGKYDEMFKGEAPVTVDRWIVRALGFTDDNVSAKGRYQAAQELITHLSDQLGWTPKQAQAAIWVAVKAEREGSDVGAASLHVGTSIDRVAHQMRLAFENTPDFPEFQMWSPRAQDAFSRATADALGAYLRRLRIPHTLSGDGPGMTTGHVGSNERLGTLLQRGETERVYPEQQAYYAGVAAGIGQALERASVRWLKLLVPENKADRSAVFVSRPNLTSDELAALKAAGGNMQIDPGDGGVWFSRDKSLGEDPAFDDRVATIVDDTLGPDTEAVAYGHEGGTLQGGTEYETALRDSPRPGDIAASSRALADDYAALRDEYRADPDGAARRHVRRSNAAERRRSSERRLEPPHPQTREHDILGASEWLGGPEGKRIIYLTERADASTVMHELFGHAGDEMKSFHPQEFAKVEQEMGVPYMEWGTSEHERFATWAERYFKDGLAPTPELVPIFDRMKAWMRTIYDGMTRLLGPRIPLATKTLFDAYFGAFDDENAFRVAASMHKAPLMSADESHLNGASVMAKQRLATAQKRSATLKEKRSLDGLIARLDELKAKDEWTDAEANEYANVYGQALAKAADEATRQDIRERQLRVKLADINKGLANPPDSPRFEGARHSMRDMSDYREQVLRDVFGDDYDLAFAQRVDLLPDWLHHQGLLKGDYEPGSAGYYPHRVSGGALKRIAAPAVSLVHRVRGRVDTSGLGLSKQNQMILWQNGDWSTDPHVLMEAAIRASGYAHTKEVVDSLWNIGRPLTREEEHKLVDLPADAYIINPNGTPISPHLRAGLNRKTTTLDAHRALEGVDGGSNESLEASIHDYIENTVLDGGDLPNDFDAGAVPGLRVVSKSLVHQILRPLEGSGRAPGQVLDFASTLARWSLIYANVPGYAIANSLGNTGFLIAQQGWLLPFNAVRAMRQLYGNGKLVDAVDGEIGELPAFAAVQRGREFSENVRTVETKALRRISVVDRIPRRSAWMYEAHKAGYRTAADKLRLIAGETPKALRDRERVATLTAEHMVNFDRLSPFERSRITRFLFVYPWIRAATAWPFWYAAQYPERVALAGALALPLEQRRKELLGGLHPPKGLSAEEKRKWFATQRPLIPPWYQGLTPLRTRGTGIHRRADVLNATSIGPASTAQQSLETIYDTFASLLGQEPTPLTNRLVDSLMPFLRDTAAASTLSSPTGQAQSLRDVLSGMFTDVIPGPRFYEALANPGAPNIWPLGTPTGAPKIFTQDDPITRAEHTFLRLAPAEISIARMNAQTAIAHTPTAAEQLQMEIDASKNAWQKAEPGLPVDQAVTRGAKITVLYRQAVKEMQARKKADRQWDPKPLVSGGFQKLPDLSSYEQARLAYKVIKQVYPGLDQNDLPAPDRYLRDEGLNPNSVEGKIALDKYHSKVLSVFTKATKKVKNVAKKVDLEKALEREQANAG